MNTIGIDISKGWVDCLCSARNLAGQFPNTPNGWKQLNEWKEGDPRVIMEASGPYYLGLATYLYEQGIKVSVVNPLVIRRYGQMKLVRIKTDAKDAALIAQYGIDQQPDLWCPPSKARRGLKKLMSMREGPGIGVIGAYTILTETDDMRRFPSPGQYLSYSRLVPGAANSGGKSRHRNSKQGNRYLKAIYTEAAVRAVQWYPVVREFYNKKTRRSGKRIARAIVAKELAKIVWHMLYYDQSYQGFKGRPTRAKTPQWPRLASP